MAPIKYVNIDIAELFLFENYVISQIKEDAVLEPENGKMLIDALKKHFKKRPFVYISNRVYNYTVSPMTNMQASKVKTLLGICIVAQEEYRQNSARYEGTFYKKDFHVCATMEEGIIWAATIAKNVE